MPDVPARGAIVLCPPLGREYTYSHATFRQLADRLVELGFAVLRFDYRSTGDSFERAGPDPHGFAHDVQSAVEFVRELGADHIGMVGMRLGANFAGAQLASTPLDAVVLWDPCASGRSFLREQRALAFFAGVRMDESPDALDLPAFKLSPDMAQEIVDVDLLADKPLWSGSGPSCDKTLLLTRSERAADLKTARRFDPARVEHRTVTGQPTLLDVHDDWPVVPADALATVAAWLDDVMPTTGTAITVPSRDAVVVTASPGAAALVGVPGGSATPITERAVRLGPAGLFGLETEQVGGGSGPVCVFVSVANEHRIGPGRLWVQLSRRLALEGFRSVRLDINGFGDSPARDGRVDEPVHSASAIDDVVDAARAVSPEDPRAVLLFGLCSSGYQILEAASIFSPRGVCAMNPSVIFVPPESESDARTDPRRRFFQGLPGPPPPVKPTVLWLKRTLPSFSQVLAETQQVMLRGWRRLRGRFSDGPGRRVGELVQAGTDVQLICGFGEVQLLYASGLDAASRLDRDGRLHVEVIRNLNHGLFPVRDRELVADLIIDHVVGRYGPERAKETPSGLAPDAGLRASTAEVKARR